MQNQLKNIISTGNGVKVGSFGSSTASDPFGTGAGKGSFEVVGSINISNVNNLTFTADNSSTVLFDSKQITVSAGSTYISCGQYAEIVSPNCAIYVNPSQIRLAGIKDSTNLDHTLGIEGRYYVNRLKAGSGATLELYDTQTFQSWLSVRNNRGIKLELADAQTRLGNNIFFQNEQLALSMICNTSVQEPDFQLGGVFYGVEIPWVNKLNLRSTSWRIACGQDIGLGTLSIFSAINKIFLNNTDQSVDNKKTLLINELKKTLSRIVEDPDEFINENSDIFDINS